MNLIRQLLDKKIPAHDGCHWPLLFSLIILSFPVCAEDNNDKDKSAELESVRSQIKSVQTDIDSAKTEFDRLQQELQRTEQTGSDLSLKIRELQVQIDKRHERLEELNAVIDEHRRSLKKEQQELGQQIRAAYMSGRNDYLKLILNQEDPARMGRMLAYYDYFNRQRINSINQVREKVDIITSLQNSIIDETNSMEQLKDRQIGRNEELQESRQSRNEILAQMQQEIDEKGLQLKSLQEHESKLAKLFENLNQMQPSSNIFDKDSPFGSLKGKLDWPLKGSLLNTFGSSRKGETLKWQGVRISTSSGAEVTAIYNGIVIFADWFRNLGQLIIIDHGNGYMSLYGYNSNLLKKTGDQVLSGETIAYAGDTGGQSSPSLYFEIRHNGKPLNPVQWCKR